VANLVRSLGEHQCLDLPYEALSMAYHSSIVQLTLIMRFH
jgi:hypothetical protein